MSFHREKFVAAGGPDGGDGGRGGDIIFVADDHLSTLMDFRYKRKYVAPEGGKGGASLCHGKNAEDLVIKVPLGTVIKDAESGLVIADLSDHTPVTIAKGGRGGSGAQKGSTTKTCPDCGGRGQVNVQQRTPFGVISTTKTCPKCGGKGKIVEKPCQKCRGGGRVSKRRELEVNIPAGIDDRQVISVRGEGSMGSNGGPSGDLHVSVFVRPHPFFEREGYNIWYDCKVNFVQAALGDSIMVPTIDGKVKFDLPAGTQPGTVMSLKGKGIQYLNSRGRGDQYIRIIVEVPKDLTAPQREALKNFKDTMGYSDVTPDEKRGFFGKKKK